jgi:hypothetical protein
MHQNMKRKEIKAIAKKQLKNNYPNWKRLNKREKEEIAKKVLDEVVASYNFKKEIKTDKAELLDIEMQDLASGMMNIDAMARLIEEHANAGLFKFNRVKTDPSCFKDKEFSIIDELLDDHEGFFPRNILRAELLKSIKYPDALTDLLRVGSLDWRTAWLVQYRSYFPNGTLLRNYSRHHHE